MLHGECGIIVIVVVAVFALVLCCQPADPIRLILQLQYPSRPPIRVERAMRALGNCSVCGMCHSQGKGLVRLL
jgi:hypothetical protein